MHKNGIYVAVVDDDESFGLALGRMLRAAGFHVVLFASAEEFLAPPPLPTADCMVLDIQMGGMSGFDLRRFLTERGTKTPVIFVTALDEPAIRDEAWGLGCSNYFGKPVPGRLLIQAIYDAVQASHQP
jgi:FixJ family two-component response regulator